MQLAGRWAGRITAISLIDEAYNRNATLIFLAASHPDALFSGKSDGVVSSSDAVFDGALDGGVNSSLNLDTHGKSLSYRLLDLPIRVPKALLPLLVGPNDEAPISL